HTRNVTVRASALLSSSRSPKPTVAPSKSSVPRGRGRRSACGSLSPSTHQAGLKRANPIGQPRTSRCLPRQTRNHHYFPEANLDQYLNILLEYDDETHVALLTINRADKLNALNRALLDELSSALDRIATEDRARALVITGAGTRAFVAGA